jgi:hypothetical protein
MVKSDVSGQEGQNSTLEGVTLNVSGFGLPGIPWLPKRNLINFILLYP